MPVLVRVELAATPLLHKRPKDTPTRLATTGYGTLVPTALVYSTPYTVVGGPMGTSTTGPTPPKPPPVLLGATPPGCYTI